MSERASVTVPMSPELLLALDAIVAARTTPDTYPRPTRASVVRALIDEARIKVKRAEAKAKPEAA